MTTESETLYQRLMAADGVTTDQLGYYCSTLFVMKTPYSTDVIKTYCVDHGFALADCAMEVNNPQDGKCWYAITFAYTPFWHGSPYNKTAMLPATQEWGRDPTCGGAILVDTN